jgi:hypothetical protein
MICRICNKEVPDKFYRHLNSSHKIKKIQYLEMFPEELEEYKNQVPDIWNKGKTKESDKRIASIAKKIKDYSNQAHVKKNRSENMKKAYEKGDILTPESRKKVVKIASNAWVDKVKSASPEERKKILFAFTSAGNAEQKKLREHRTPADYQRLYPFAKGKAKYGNCAFCDKQIIIWVGGKPRPKLRFCSNECNNNYRKVHPNYVFNNTGRPYYSKKMNCEFFLRSRLEMWLSELLDDCSYVKSWFATPCSIDYNYDGKIKKYFPDFLINEKFLLELKSLYVYQIDAKKSESKLKAGEAYSLKNSLIFCYWQFNDSNMNKKKFCSDERVVSFFKGIEND